MTSIGKRVTQCLEEQSLSEYALAKKLNIHHSNIQSLTSGRVKKPRYLGELAEALHVSEKWLRTGEGEKSIQNLSSPHIELADMSQQSFEDHGKNLPVYSIPTQIKGSGARLNEKKEINQISRPFRLSHNRDVFALYADDPNIYPKYEIGDLIFIDPNVPYSASDYVLLEIKTEESSKVHIRKYLCDDGEFLSFKQFHPEKEYKIKKSHILHIYRIIPMNELF